MPTFSSITLRFEDDFELGYKFNMSSVLDNLVYLSSAWRWVTTRSGVNQVEVGTPTANAGERTAINFRASFYLDYPTGYVVTQNLNEVTINSETEAEFWASVVPIEVGDSLEVSITNVDDTDPENPYAYASEITVMIERYFITYCDDFNTDRQVKILQRGYIGISKELMADVNPITLTYESADDFKFSPIRPSVATVNMIFGGADGIDFEEFWTADEREFQVQDIKDGTVEWTGFVTANGFQYDFHGGLYYASIEASDGLGSLKSIPFVDDNQKPYGNQDLAYNDEFEFPFSLIITEILFKLGLSLDLWTCVDSYETTMTKTGDVREADPLSAAFVNVKTYIKQGENEKVPYWYGSGEEWNCEEVLENILYIFGAKLYQEFGVWRVKTINADVDYGTGATQRYWRKYNTAGVYLEDYEVIDDEVEIPCGDNTKYLIENNHVMSMDDVYKAFRMNYEYTFLRDGDSPLNLLPNGDFCDFLNTSILAAPTGWERWRRDNKWYIRIKDITVPFASAGGHTCGIEVGTHKTGIPVQQGSVVTDPNPAIWTSLKTTNYPYVEKGSSLTFRGWFRYKYQSDNQQVAYFPFFRLMLWTDTEVYYLRNNVVDNQRKFTWELGKTEYNGFPPTLSLLDIFCYLPINMSSDSTSLANNYNWYYYDLELQNTPVAGNLEFHIHGLAANRGRDSSNFPSPQSYEETGNPVQFVFTNWLRVVRENWIDEGGDIPRLQITGMEIGIIPNEDELPQQQDFIYENENTNYSLQVDPITVYNGDLQDEYHISNISVPTNTTGGKNFWDDLGGSYGSSSLGLLTVREIMRQYQKPYRILEGNVKIQDARFGTVYTFEVLPNVRFILQRGSFNRQKQWIEDATFVQLTSDVLPDGGSEGGNTLSPQWEATGNNYCQLNAFLNTGYVIIEEKDVNPNSETYGETREVISDAQDLTVCPLNIPYQYYWGNDDIFLNVFTLVNSPFTIISNKEIQISFDNVDGNYLYFVHLKTLGTIEKIYTNTTPNNVLSDWVYLSDVIINGYIYRVMRTDYVMAEFTNFTHNFKFA